MAEPGHRPVSATTPTYKGQASIANYPIDELHAVRFDEGKRHHPTPIVGERVFVERGGPSGSVGLSRSMSIFAEFSLPVTAFPPGGRLGSHPGITVELERVVPTESITYYLWFAGNDYEHVLDDLRTDPSVGSIRVLEQLDDRVLVGIHWQRMEAPVFGLIGESGAKLVDATGTADGWTATLRFPDRDALTTFYETCRQRGVTLELWAINDAGFGRRGDDLGLTPPQRETLVAAFEAGYFEVPRGTTLAKLADRLDVSEQAVSERLRRSLGTFLTTTLRDEQPSDATGTEQD